MCVASQLRNGYEIRPNYEVEVREIVVFRFRESGQKNTGGCTPIETGNNIQQAGVNSLIKHR
jgi:hypothetical protein